MQLDATTSLRDQTGGAQTLQATAHDLARSAERLGDVLVPDAGQRPTTRGGFSSIEQVRRNALAHAGEGRARESAIDVGHALFELVHERAREADVLVLQPAHGSHVELDQRARGGGPHGRGHVSSESRGRHRSNGRPRSRAAHGEMPAARPEHEYPRPALDQKCEAGGRARVIQDRARRGVDQPRVLEQLSQACAPHLAEESPAQADQVTVTELRADKLRFALSGLHPRILGAAASDVFPIARVSARTRVAWCGPVRLGGGWAGRCPGKLRERWESCCRMPLGWPPSAS